MSDDKVCRKDMCWFVRIVYVLIKLKNVSRPGLEEAGRYTTSTCCSGSFVSSGFLEAGKQTVGPPGRHLLRRADEELTRNTRKEHRTIYYTQE